MMHSPPHIGQFAREIVTEHGLNVPSAARVLGVTRRTLSTLMNCQGGLSSEMAVRFEKAFGVQMETMLRMQTSFAIARVRKRADAIHVERFAPVAA